MFPRFLVPAAAGLLFAMSAFADQVGYTIDVTTSYAFTLPATLNNVSGAPDTSYFTVTNNGTTTFNGTIGDVAVACCGIDYSFTSGALTLAPGQSVAIGLGPLGGGGEASNVGGFNGPQGSPQPGVQILLNGNMNGTEAVGLSVFDKDIHSGVVNGSGLTDAYVLQGGNPLGNDNGDAIETTQAPGHFEFSEAAAVPEPGYIALIGMGLPAVMFFSRRRRAQVK